MRAYSAAFSRVDAQAPDWDAFTGKGGVLALADAAAAEGCMGPSREAYPALLARYPLCYGFWKKWALQEWAQCSPLGDGRVPQPDRAAALAASVAVWETGVQAVTHSVEHWVNYCEFLGAQCGEDPARVRSALLRGVACCALDPKAGALWEALLRVEAALGGAGLGALYAQALGSGAPYVPQLYAKFKAAAAALAPQQLLAEGEGEGDAALAALAAAAQGGSKDSAQALRAHVLARREAAVTQSLQDIGARSALEGVVGKRPYYHVKPLDATIVQVRSRPHPHSPRL